LSARRLAEELKDAAPDGLRQRSKAATLAVSLHLGEKPGVDSIAMERGRFALAGVHAAKPMHVRSHDFRTKFVQHSCITSM
jgi:hypothetical protein